MNVIADVLKIYRRNLPHWRVHGAVYFVTWRVHRNQEDLRHEERDVVVNALRHFDRQRYELHGYVVMNDHVHVFVCPNNGYTLEGLCHSWKSFTARELQMRFGRSGHIWQSESFDRIIRNEDEYSRKLTYVLNNPRRRWPDLKQYKWVWVKGM